MRNFTFTFMIILAQGVGAMLGTGICALGFDYEKQGDAGKIPDNGFHVLQLCPSNGCNDGGDLFIKVFFTETICTFLFCSFVLMIVKHNGA